MGRANRAVRSALKRWLNQTGVSLLVGGVTGLGRLLPPGLADRLGALLGGLTYRLNPRDRRRALENLRLVLGRDLDERGREDLARRAFRSQGRSVLEAVRLAGMTPGEVEECIEYEGWDALERAAALGRGILVVGGHLGNWELMAAGLGVRYPVNAVARRMTNPEMDRRMIEARERFGIRTIVRGAPDEKERIRQAFARNQIMGTLIDQDSVKTRGIFVPFLGRMAYTPSGPAALALKQDVPIVTGCCVRRPGRRFLLRLDGPLQWERTGDLARDVELATAAMTAAFEGYVRTWPDQWSWFHRRWRTTPERLAEIQQRRSDTEGAGT